MGLIISRVGGARHGEKMLNVRNHIGGLLRCVSPNTLLPARTVDWLHLFRVADVPYHCRFNQVYTVHWRYLGNIMQAVTQSRDNSAPWLPRYLVDAWRA